jgi:putative endopeptidase
MRLCLTLAIVFALCISSLAQTAPASTSISMPAVEHFSIDQVDKTLDPCTDFFQYACSKWLKANPIPPDQGGAGAVAFDRTMAGLLAPVDVERNWRLP